MLLLRNMSSLRHSVMLAMLWLTSCGLTSCGFTPVYKQYNAESSGVAQLAVVTAPSREGQLLRAALEDALGTISPEQARYRVNVSVAIAAQPISIESDGTTRRFRLLGQSNAVITDTHTSQSMYTTNVQRVSSYNISDDDYSTYIAGRDAREQVINALADTLRLRILAFLHHHTDDDNTGS